MFLGGLYALPHFDEELVDVVLEQLGCPLVAGVGGLVLFDVDEDEADVLDNREYQVLVAVVPV